MRIEERFVIDAPAELLWPLLREPEQIAACFPGAALDGQDDDGGYLGRMTVRFGPTTAVFNGRAAFDIDDAARSGRVEARGQDRRGSSRAAATATVRLVPQDAASVLEVSGDIEVSGPLAGFAESGGVHLARVLFADFATSVVQRLDTSVPAPPPPAPPSGFRLLLRVFGAWLRQLRPGRRGSVR